MTKSLTHQIFVAVVVCLLNFGNLSTAKTVNASSAKEAAPVSLQLAALIHNRQTTLVLMITNNSDRDILTVPVGNIFSHIVVTHPDGQTKDNIGFIDFPDVSTVKPSETVIWKRSISMKEGRYGFVEPGLYQIHWKWREFTPRKSDPAGEYYRSNEILLLREKEISETSAALLSQPEYIRQRYFMATGRWISLEEAEEIIRNQRLLPPEWRFGYNF